jgi:hypothetical protein
MQTNKTRYEPVCQNIDKINVSSVSHQPEC